MSKRKQGFLLIALTVVILPLTGQASESDSPAAKPEVAAVIDVFDAWAEYRATRHEQPGVSIGLVYDQELIWAKGYGYADLVTKTTATPSTAYRIASLSKTFTATAIGTGLVGYRWRYEGIEIPGAVGPIYTIDPVQAGDAGAYDVVAFDLCGYGTSLRAILSITESGTGDGNGDGQTDGADIAGFIGAVLDEGATPNSCAYDMDTDGSVMPSDVALFVEALLAT